jgi:predicted RNA-binding Zn-ribbon protein involved in translation (DUF1610 family)
MGQGSGLIIIAALIYFIPSIIGYFKQHGVGILLLNLFLGWTVIGWIAALIWAVSDRAELSHKYTCPKCGYVHGLDQRVKIHVCPQCRFEQLY